MEEKKIFQLRKYIAYGTGFLGDAFYYQFITTYLLVFLTGPAGLTPKNAGTVGSIIVLADAVGSLFVGRVTDGLKCKYGRRRPVLLFSAFVLPLIFCLLFVTVGGTDSQKVVYYTAMGLLFYLFFILYYVSQTAFGADISDGYDDSIKMNSESCDARLPGHAAARHQVAAEPRTDAFRRLVHVRFHPERARVLRHPVLLERNAGQGKARRRRHEVPELARDAQRL